MLRIGFVIVPLLGVACSGLLDWAGGDPGDPSHPDAPVAGGVDGGGPRAWTFDLDRDGVPETDLSVQPCQAGRLCLRAESAAGASEVLLPEGAKSADGGTALVMGRRLRALGDHAGGPLSEISVLYQLARGDHDSPALAIVDLESGTVVAHTEAPAALTRFGLYALASFTDFPSDPEGRLHPFLAPGYGDTAEFAWGRLCLYRAGAGVDPDCGPDFLPANVVPPSAGWFREVGAYLQDLDGDGWEDVNLIYHHLILTISARTAERLAVTEFDPAAEEGALLAGFHSGRNYGTHASFRGTDGKLRNLIVAGAAVGTFTDLNCNVSRFVAVLESDAGLPASRRMPWSDYFGFSSTIFSVTNDPTYAADPSPVVARLGDFADGCIHRLSDSRVVIDGVEAVLFDYFLAEGPVDACLDEQYALGLDPPTNWMDAKSEAWYACLNGNVASRGRWGMQARRIADGAGVTGSLDTYVWAKTDRVLPTGETVYLVEMLPPTVRFDLADVAPTPLRVFSLVAGLWTPRGTLPAAARPAIQLVTAEGPNAVGSFTGLAEPFLEDRDGDGLAEVQLEGGIWVGWDGSDFAVK